MAAAHRSGEPRDGVAVFERYTESARRTLFFSRYESSQLGGRAIEPEHLLLGLLREAPQMIARFATRGPVESMRATIERSQPAQEKVSTSGEIPFSLDCKRVLQHAAAEIEGLDTVNTAGDHAGGGDC